MSFLVENLSVKRGSFLVTLERLEIAPGEIVCLMGRSGSGKSTLLHALAGFLPLEGGEIVGGMLALQDLPPERRRIGLVFQRGALFPHLTALDNVAFGLKMQGVGMVQRRAGAMEWLARVEMEWLALRYPHQLSEGQAQRVALARALAPRFPVLLLDEPFSALDRKTREPIRALLRRLVEETKACALLVTHHEEDALAAGGRLFLMHEGRCSPAPRHTG